MKTAEMFLLMAIGVTTIVSPSTAASNEKPILYPLETCLVSGQKLTATGKPYVFVTGNREIKLCCKVCLNEFNETSANYLPKLDAAAKTATPYPLETCVVSGQALGKKGESYDLVREGQAISLCCKGCLSKFEKHRSRYLAKIRRAQEAVEPQAEQASIPPALDTRPGGLAWPGY